MRAEHADVGDAYGAGVQDSRDPRANSAHIRVDTAHAYARRGRAVGDVGMDINQARRHKPIGAADFEDTRRLRSTQVWLNRGDGTPGNANVHAPVEPLPWVQYVAAFDQQVIRHDRRGYRPRP